MLPGAHGVAHLSISLLIVGFVCIFFGILSSISNLCYVHVPLSFDKTTITIFFVNIVVVGWRDLKNTTQTEATLLYTLNFDYHDCNSGPSGVWCIRASTSFQEI